MEDSIVENSKKHRGIYSLAINKLTESGVKHVRLDDGCTKHLYSKKGLWQDYIFDVENTFDRFTVGEVNEAAEEMVVDLSRDIEINYSLHSLKRFDSYTYEHSVSVAKNAVIIGIGLKLSYNNLVNMAAGALLHDIGKAEIPIEILNKPGKLESHEMDIVKRHPDNGRLILKNEELIHENIIKIVHQHHENWDGTGYPNKKKGEEIYELAHITHICDVYDALISKRVYKDAQNQMQAIKFIEDNSGKMFKPEIVEMFMKFIPNLS
jgi:putative nucleotidyltransferase with HDIG domain